MLLTTQNAVHFFFWPFKGPIFQCFTGAVIRNWASIQNSIPQNNNNKNTHNQYQVNKYYHNNQAFLTHHLKGYTE